MPKQIPGLTVRAIDSAKANETLYDGKGLALVVDGNRNKRWVLRYTRPDGRRNMIGLGSYPGTSLSLAREMVKLMREQLARDIDPSIARKLVKRDRQLSFRGMFKTTANDWYNHREKEWAADTARKVREVLDDYLLPPLGAKSIADITSAEIKPVLVAMHERAPSLAFKARQYCNQIITFAIQEGLREDGRMLSLKGILPRQAKSHFPAVTSENGLPDLIRAIEKIDSSCSKSALWMCLYTALRPGVVAGARWDEIDLIRKEWHIPAARMKSGNDHISPLPDQMITKLRELKVLAGESPFVFPGVSRPMTQHLHRDSLSKVLRENGLSGVTVTHGFRATFRTIARERLRADADVLEAQLAHAKKGEVQAAYDRTQLLDERHELAQRWANFLGNIRDRALNSSQ